MEEAVEPEGGIDGKCDQSEPLTAAALEIDAGKTDRRDARTLLDALIARTPAYLLAARARLFTQSAYLHSLRREAEPSLREAQEAVRLCRMACAHGDLANVLHPPQALRAQRHIEEIVHELKRLVPTN